MYTYILYVSLELKYYLEDHRLLLLRGHAAVHRENGHFQRNTKVFCCCAAADDDGDLWREPITWRR